MNHIAGGISTYSRGAFLDLPHWPKQLLNGSAAYVRDESKTYIDFTASLGAVLRGYTTLPPYAIPPLLPGPHTSEEDAAALLCQQTGWSQVRWCKNGSDATEAAVRLARYVSWRKNIICNSYHGSHSDLVTATDGKTGGVLTATQCWLTRCTSPLSILDAINTKTSAAVIMEPLTPDCQDWQLAEIREACTRTGTILIFDEIITGWRTRLGSCTDVRPDISCFGKAIGNGMPIACVAGNRELLRHFEQDVFFSGTNATEIYSLLACHQTLTWLEEYKRLYPSLRERWADLATVLHELVVGYPGRLTLRLPEDTHRAFVDALATKGILVGRDFFLMFSHLDECGFPDEEWERVLSTIREVRKEVGI